MLRNEGVDPLDVAYKLSSVLPKIISIKFDSSGSANTIHASLLDIVAAAQQMELGRLMLDSYSECFERPWA